MIKAYFQQNRVAYAYHVSIQQKTKVTGECILDFVPVQSSVKQRAKKKKQELIIERENFKMSLNV